VQAKFTNRRGSGGVLQFQMACHTCHTKEELLKQLEQ